MQWAPPPPVRRAARLPLPPPRPATPGTARRGLNPEDLAEGGDEAGGDADPDAVDSLREELVKRRMLISDYVVRAARMIAPMVAERGAPKSTGYDWVAEVLEACGQKRLAGEVQLAKAEQLLSEKDFQGAIDLLKSFEKKDRALRARAAGSLSSIAFLEGDYDAAERNADLALAADKYNAQALVARGNVQAAKGELEEALKCYEEALRYESTMVDALYNSGLVSRKLALRDQSTGGEVDPSQIDWASPEHAWRRGKRDESIETFKKLAMQVRAPPRSRPPPPPADPPQSRRRPAPAPPARRSPTCRTCTSRSPARTRWPTGTPRSAARPSSSASSGWSRRPGRCSWARTRR